MNNDNQAKFIEELDSIINSVNEVETNVRLKQKYLKYKKKYTTLKNNIYYQLGSASKNEVCQLDSLNMVSVTRSSDFKIDQVDHLSMYFFEKLFGI